MLYHLIVFTVRQHFEVPWNVIPSVILHAVECTKHCISNRMS